MKRGNVVPHAMGEVIGEPLHCMACAAAHSLKQIIRPQWAPSCFKSPKQLKAGPSGVEPLNSPLWQPNGLILTVGRFQFKFAGE
jgi:hypothetical protein